MSLPITNTYKNINTRSNTHSNTNINSNTNCNSVYTIYIWNHMWSVYRIICLGRNWR